MSSCLLQLKEVSVFAGKKPLMTGASFEVFENDFFVIVGPNGAGKTTLVRAICGDVPYTGEILLDGKDIRALKAKEFAREIGVLSQRFMPAYDFTAREVVELGRYAHSKGIFPGLKAADNAVIDAAMDAAGVAELKERDILTLSGGEMQRVNLAKLFAQEPRILLLDEPANHLDFAHQLKLFALLDEWRKKPGNAVIAVAHDFNLVKAFGTRAAMINDAGVYAAGTVKEVFKEENLKAVYELDIAEWMRLQLKDW